MGTPRKSFNYYSPYSQNVPHYPSQTMDYMSQHAGGPQGIPVNTQEKLETNSNQNRPHFYQNKTQQRQDVGFYEDRQSSNPNTPHYYQNQRGSPRNFRQRGGRRGQQNHYQNQRQFGDRNVNASSQYFHSSMLEDPWRELMERHNAIHGTEQNTEVEA